MIDLQRVGAEERLTRYLDEKKKFSVVNKRVKFNAFTPPSNLRLSIFRTDELGEGEIWGLGDAYVAPIRKKQILARADLSVSEFTNRGLLVEPDTQPHERHANVVNWPQNEGEEAWLKIATELANAAELVPR